MSSALIIYCWNIKPSPSLFLPISLTRMSGCPLFHREIDSWVVPIPKDLQRRHEYRTRSTAPPPTLLSGPITKHLQVVHCSRARDGVPVPLHRISTDSVSRAF
ncbi:hypothetical protein DTO207G8_1494 [Paecilomyces variotii]|nr:hypothetical protein DTO207G8_1494 [Paecilomyces variotii]